MTKQIAIYFAALAIAASVLAFPSLCEDFQGKVVRIVDGDTLDVLYSQQAQRVRLYGVDAPEKSQPFGSRARQFTAGLVFGHTVTVRDKGRDRYGRALAEITRSDGRSLNRELVANGFAWHYKHYSSDLNLAQIEEIARKQKRGLWIDAGPIAPWEFRKFERQQKAIGDTRRHRQDGSDEGITR